MNTNKTIPMFVQALNFDAIPEDAPEWMPPDIKPEELTCFACPHRATCEYVDDHYNIHGDCLAMK